MNNTRTIVMLLLAALIAAAFWGAIHYFNRLEKEQRPSSPSLSHDETLTVTIHITAQGFEPRNMEIAKGESVLFINDDTSAHWPASDVHPLHTTCPGFDALRGLNTGEQYRVTFTKSQTCPFHDHLNPSLTGIIITK